MPRLESRMRSNFSFSTYTFKIVRSVPALRVNLGRTRSGPLKGYPLSSIVQSLLPHHVNRASSVTTHNFFGDFPDKLFQNYFVCDALPVLIATTSIN